MVTWIFWCGTQMFGPKIKLSQWMVMQRTQKRNINIGKRKIRTIRDHGPQGKTVLQEEGSGQVSDAAKMLYERLRHTIWTKGHHTRESCFGGWGG